VVETDDAMLMERIRGGDREALDTLLNRNADRIFGFGMRICRNREDAEEVLQETMLAVAKSAETWRGDAAFSTWLYTIARNACARRRRRRVGEPQQMESIDEPSASADLSQMHSDLCVPEEELERSRMRDALTSAIDALPSDMREIVILRDVEGLRAREVADTLQISVPAVKSRLHRARARLRTSLRPLAPREDECPDVIQALSESIEGDLDRQACASLEQHVAACDQCRGRCDALREVLTLCADSPTAHVPEPVRRATVLAMREALER
jgi:RNA polymerase sigma-70 factor (ECF subfamily)